VIDWAIRSSRIFIACLSTNSVNHREFFQAEFKTAYEVWQTASQFAARQIAKGVPWMIQPEDLRRSQIQNYAREARAGKPAPEGQQPLY
jgi:hypothetical protein